MITIKFNYFRLLLVNCIILKSAYILTAPFKKLTFKNTTHCSMLPKVIAVFHFFFFHRAVLSQFVGIVNDLRICEFSIC